MGNIYTSTTFMEHNSHPDYKYEMDSPTHSHDGINPSCGDELTLMLRVENGVIEEASFTGHGCAISQASADIMADLITGETVEEAKRLSGLFLAMIRGEELSEDDFEDLDEAAQLKDISHCIFHMPFSFREFPREVRRARLAHPRRHPLLTCKIRTEGILHSTAHGRARRCSFRHRSRVPPG